MRHLILLHLLLFLASCGSPKTSTLVKTTQDGKTTITISGKKQMSLSPFSVTMTVKSGDIPEGSLLFEIVADDINDSNVRVDWSDAQHGMITFTQRDNAQKIFSITVSDTQVLVVPVKV